MQAPAADLQSELNQLRLEKNVRKAQLNEDPSVQALQRARSNVQDPQMRAAFDSLEEALGETLEHITRLQAITAKGQEVAQATTHHIQGLERDQKKLAALREAIQELEGSPSIIASYVSGVAARKLREASAKGDLAGVTRIFVERSKWPAYMVMSGCDPADHHGNTALLLAAQAGHADVVQLLCDKGADPNLANHTAATPLHVAKSKEIARLLLVGGASTVSLDDLERTPYDVHKANRLGGGSDVVHAFSGLEHQVTGKIAREILREANLTDEERAARAAAVAAEVARLAEEERVAMVKALYARGVGSEVVKDWERAVASLQEVLDIEPGHAQAFAKLQKLAEAGHCDPPAPRAPAEAADREHGVDEAEKPSEGRVEALKPTPPHRPPSVVIPPAAAATKTAHHSHPSSPPPAQSPIGNPLRSPRGRRVLRTTAVVVALNHSVSKRGKVVGLGGMSMLEPADAGRESARARRQWRTAREGLLKQQGLIGTCRLSGASSGAAAAVGATPRSS